MSQLRASLIAAVITAGVAAHRIEGTPQAPWRLEPDLRIAADTGPASFTAIIAMEVDRAGRIFALERNPREVRVFEPNGSFLRRLGRVGEGPGEYREAFGLAWDSLGRLMIVDHRNSRYTFFDTSGTLAGTSARGQMGIYGYRWSGAVMRDGRVVEFAFRMDPASGRMLLLVLGPDGRATDSLNLPRGPEGAFYRVETGGGRKHGLPRTVRAAARLAARSARVRLVRHRRSLPHHAGEPAR